MGKNKMKPNTDILLKMRVAYDFLKVMTAAGKFGEIKVSPAFIEVISKVKKDKHR